MTVESYECGILVIFEANRTQQQRYSVEMNNADSVQQKDAGFRI